MPEKPFTLVLAILLSFDCFGQSKSTMHRLSFSETGDTIKTIRETNEYDNNGRSIRTTYFDNGKVINNSERTFNDLGKVVEVKLKLIGFSGKIESSTTLYFYDRIGRLEKKIVNHEKNNVDNTVYYYDRSDTLLVKETRSIGLVAIYSYDSLRNNTQIEYFRNGRLDYAIKYDYNEKRQQIHYTTSSDPGWHNYNLYDREGNFVEFLRFDEKGTLAQKIKYFYNQKNKLIRMEQFNEILNEPDIVYVTTYK